MLVVLAPPLLITFVSESVKCYLIYKVCHEHYHTHTRTHTRTRTRTHTHTHTQTHTHTHTHTHRNAGPFNKSLVVSVAVMAEHLAALWLLVLTCKVDAFPFCGPKSEERKRNISTRIYFYDHMVGHEMRHYGPFNAVFVVSLFSFAKRIQTLFQPVILR